MHPQAELADRMRGMRKVAQSGLDLLALAPQFIGCVGQLGSKQAACLALRLRQKPAGSLYVL